MSSKQATSYIVKNFGHLGKISVDVEVEGQDGYSTINATATIGNVKKVYGISGLLSTQDESEAEEDRVCDDAANMAIIDLKDSLKKAVGETRKEVRRIEKARAEK